MILLVDNYDSFVWNLEHALRLAASAEGLDPTVAVVRHDEIDPARARALRPTHLVLSPGPCGPYEAGACIDLVRTLAGELPILGVCLGHQAIAAAFKIRVVRADEPVHGKPWEITHDQRTLFAGLPSPMRVGRYHSLIVPEPDALAAHDVDGGWEVSARTREGVVMGLRRIWRAHDHRAPLEGVQFHPESYLTEHGVALLANFLRLSPPPPRAVASDTIAAR